MRNENIWVCVEEKKTWIQNRRACSGEVVFFMHVAYYHHYHYHSKTDHSFLELIKIAYEGMMDSKWLCVALKN